MCTAHYWLQHISEKPAKRRIESCIMQQTAVATEFLFDRIRFNSIEISFYYKFESEAIALARFAIRFHAHSRMPGTGLYINCTRTQMYYVYVEVLLQVYAMYEPECASAQSLCCDLTVITCFIHVQIDTTVDDAMRCDVSEARKIYGN